MVIPIPNIYDLIFQILQVTPTGNAQADFLNLIFFPNIVIIIWLFMIARGNFLRTIHKGLGVLLSIAIYVFIVYYGWYPIIANFAMLWLGITIVVSFFYFMMPKFMHPGATEQRFQLGRNIADIGKERVLIDRTIERLKDELEKTRRQRVNNPNAGDKTMQYLIQREREIDSQIRELEDKKRLIH